MFWPIDRLPVNIKQRYQRHTGESADFLSILIDLVIDTPIVFCLSS